MITDLRFAFRQLLKSPGFSLLAIITLALGIGVNTAIFSLVHDLFLRGLTFEKPDRLVITATVTTTARTGVEMEALTAVSVAALTVYDMCKAIDRSMTIVDVCLREKTGGRSGDYRRTE